MKHIYILNDSSEKKILFSNLLRQSGLLLLMLMLLSTSIHAQRGNANGSSIDGDDLIGTWILDYNASKSSIKSNVKQAFDKMTRDQKTRRAARNQNKRFVFKVDGTLVIKLNSGVNSSATWTLDGNNELITVTDENGHVRNYQVSRFQNKKLVLKVKTDNHSNSAVLNELHLKKQ